MRLLIEGARHRLQRATAALCVVAAFGLPVAASAEVKEVQNEPNSWQDYFFEEIHNLPGS